MNTIIRLKYSLLLTAVAVTTAFAQNEEEATSEPTDELAPLTVSKEFLYSDQVTALKTPTPIIDVPQSLSITTAEDIQDRGFNSIGDIINYTPGVTMSQGEGHRDAVVFRGVRSTADFFVDGVRDDVQYYRPLYNVEQVEILRGPNALFFGRGGTGGILNRVMKKGVTGETFNTYAFGVDTFGGVDAQIDSNVVINENSAFRINAFYEHLENDRDFYDGDRFGVNPTAKFLLSEQTTLDVSYEYIDHERFIDRGIPTGDDNEPVEDLDNIVFGDRDNNNSELEAHIVRALLQHQISENVKANLTASYGDYDKMYENLYASGYDEPTNIVTLDGYRDTTERQTALLSGNVIWEFFTGDIEHTTIFGAEYSHTSSDQDRQNTFWTTTGNDKEEFNATRPINIRNGSGTNAAGNPTTFTYSDPNDDTSVDLDVYSVFFQDEIQLFEQVQLVIGARFDSFQIDVDDNIGSGSGDNTDEEISPRAGIVYKPQEDTSLYLSYSTSFLPKSGEQYANLGPDEDPDEFTNYEAGLKWDFSQGLSLTTAVFYIERSAAENDGSGSGNFETVESDIYGFEAQIQGRITDKWSISAGYSYLEGEIADPDPAGNDGNDPRELPQNMFSLWNSYQLTERLGVGLGVIYQDETYITEDNDTKLPDYFRVDAAAYYQLTENLRLQVNIENLLDEDYYPDAHGDHQVTVGAPINARFAIVGSF